MSEPLKNKIYLSDLDIKGPVLFVQDVRLAVNWLKEEKQIDAMMCDCSSTCGGFDYEAVVKVINEAFADVVE